ncbi:protein translocase subunit SecF [soil metagenome]
MYRIMERRGFYFAISLVLTLPAVIYMIWSLSTRGVLLPLSIDYTGGTLWELRFSKAVDPADVRQVFVSSGFPDTSAFTVQDDRTVEVKFKNIGTDEKTTLQQKLKDKFGVVEEQSYRSIGPSIGSEISKSAVLAVGVASLLILLYIAMAFRHVTHPFRFGASAVVALVHDILVVISFICIMHLIAGWEIDALFLTATMTVMGYSVSDTIVVFDRVRENFRRHRGKTLSMIANRSIIETAHRSLATHVTTLLTLTAILVLGGPTLRQFTATLLVGISSGTYSSIFNASALLVAWDEGSWLHKEDDSTPAANGQTALA